MAELTQKPAFRVWLILIAAAVISWWLGADHGLGSGEGAVVAVLVVAFVKTWLVGQWFMELRGAPAALQRVFDGWVLCFGTAVLVLYLAG